ncbi:MAG: hypothetical protein WCJ72_05950 [Chryseobacterium sp.]
MEVLVQAFFEIKADPTNKNMRKVYIEYCNKGLITMPYRKYCYELVKLNTDYQIQQERMKVESLNQGLTYLKPQSAKGNHSHLYLKLKSKSSLARILSMLLPGHYLRKG